VITIAIITVLSVSLSAFPFENRLSSNGQQADVKLIAKYRQTTLFDVSSDGHLILLYGASTPRKDVKSGGMSQWEPKRGETYFDLLRVVEWESGRELSSIHVHKVPSAARFVEGATQICYRAQKDNNLWDYVSGHQSVCPNEPQNGAYRGSDKKYDSLDCKYVAETSKERVREVLLLLYVRGVVTIFDRESKEKVGVVLHPTIREPYDWPLAGYVYSVAFTPDNKYLVTSYEHDTYVWRIGLPQLKQIPRRASVRPRPNPPLAADPQKQRRAAEAGSLVRQAKLGAFCRVRVPAREGLTTHLYRVLQWWRKFYMD
jgi:WD40 repeat protein